MVHEKKFIEGKDLNLGLEARKGKLDTIKNFRFSIFSIKKLYRRSNCLVVQQIEHKKDKRYLLMNGDIFYQTWFDKNDKK